MPRVKGGTTSLKKRRKVLKLAKGYRHGRSKKERQAREGILHAGVHAFAHRRDKKNDFRKLWNVKINAALRPLGYSYSKFIGILKKNNIELDRKVLADIAENKPESFERLVKALK
ncbi:MAG TPA: 50S ribosomal protein L20 [Candidatus Paceibacterota bacterium]